MTTTIGQTTYSEIHGLTAGAHVMFERVNADFSSERLYGIVLPKFCAQHTRSAHSNVAATAKVYLVPFTTVIGDAPEDMGDEYSAVEDVPQWRVPLEAEDPARVAVVEEDGAVARLAMQYDPSGSGRLVWRQRRYAYVGLVRS